MKKIYTSVLLTHAVSALAGAVQPGEILMVVAIKPKKSSKNPSLQSQMIEPDWYIAPNNAYTPKMLENAMLTRCLKDFHVTSPKDLDRGVIYKQYRCTQKEGEKAYLVPLTLAAPYKLFLEAFHEFSKLWDNSKLDAQWIPDTHDRFVRRGSCGEKGTKRYTKASQYKHYTLVYEIAPHASGTGVYLTVLHGKEHQRILSLIGTRYNAKGLEKCLQDEYTRLRMQYLKI